MEATNYSYKLPVCGWGAHPGHHVPVELTMNLKYGHFQQKAQTCCCSGLRTGIQSQGSISFCDDAIRSRYRSHALRQQGELQLQHHQSHATGDDNSRRTKDPDTRRAGTLELRCGTASMSLHPHPGRSNFGHRSPMPHSAHPPPFLAAAIVLIRQSMLAPRALVRASPYPLILDFLPCH